MLKIIEINFNIGLNEMAKRKIKSDMILQYLKILKKLIRIFTFFTLINPGLENQRYVKVRKKEVENWEFFYYTLKEPRVLIRG